MTGWSTTCSTFGERLNRDRRFYRMWELGGVLFNPRRPAEILAKMRRTEEHMTDEKKDKPQTVTVEATEAHTYNGESYEAGDTYELPADLVDSVETQGKAKRVDAGDTPPRAAKKGDTSVKPLTTKDMPAGHTKK